MAAEYGWAARQVRELTDELLVMYLDEAADRIESRYAASIEAVRAGTIFAHDQKQHDRWIRSRAPRGPSLTGAALEAAVMRIAAMFPENVTRVPA